MGRPGCSSCCEVADVKVGCVHDNFTYYYKMGGAWLSHDKYLDLLFATGQKGHLALEQVGVISSKPDYGEYRTAAKGWVFPITFGGDDEKFKDGNDNQGVHIPEEWTMVLWNPDRIGQPMVMVRSLTDKSENVEYINGHFFGLYDKQGKKECHSEYEAIPDKDKWKEPLSQYLDMFGDDEKTLLQVKRTTFTVDWDTDIYYGGNLIYSERKCLPYKIEWDLFDSGLGLLAFGVETLEKKLLKLDKQGGDLRAFAEEYGTFNYCLTYPFFSHENFIGFYGDTFYFPGQDMWPDMGHAFHLFDPNVATIQDDFWGTGECDQRGDNDFRLKAVGPGANVLDPPPSPGTDWGLHHAYHSMFKSITIASKKFIVFNPYGGGFGRPVDGGEFKDYDGSFSPGGQPQFEGIVDGATIEDLENNLKIKEDQVPGATFIFVDNKFSNEYDIPQIMYAEDEGFSTTRFYSVDGGKLGDTGLNAPQTVIGLFKYLMLSEEKDGGAPLRDHVVVVYMRSMRGADEAANKVAVGDEVYFPVEGCDRFTVESIVDQDQQLNALTVKLSNGNTVSVDQIELVKDNFSYAMNGRTYYLQKTYLKDGEDKEYSNPYKYKVTRIDIRNPNVDVRVGREIAYMEALPSDDDTNIYVNPTYIKLTANDSWGSIPDEYFDADPPATYWAISNTGCEGDPNPFKVQELAEPPKSLLDGTITFTSPIEFEFEEGAPPVPREEEEFASRETTHPSYSPDASTWIITVEKDDTESNTFVAKGGDEFKKEIKFSNRQLPDNGYLFGPYIELRFYFEEIEEWKQKQGA